MTEESSPAPRLCVRCGEEILRTTASWDFYGYCIDCAWRPLSPGDDGSPKLSSSKRRVFDDYERRGFQILHGGWPDFLVIAPDGEILFVEVKSGVDRMTFRQSQMRDVLERLADYKIERTVDE